MSDLLYGCRDGMNTIALAVGIPLMNVVAVGIRFYARRRQDAAIAADDWWSLGSLVLLLALGADLLIAAVYQFLSCPSPKSEVNILQGLGDMVPHVAWAFYILAVINVATVKITFLFCMRRVFCTGEKGTWFSRVTYGVMGLVAAWMFGFVLTMALINVNWGAPNQGDPTAWGDSPATHATDMMFYAMAVSDVIIDTIIMFLPITVIFSLNLSLGRRFAIAGIFTLRLLALAASVTRMSYTVMFAKWMDALLDVDPHLVEPDHLLVGQNLNTQMIWWTMLEVGFGLFASCITTIQFLLRRRHVQHFYDRIRGILGLSVKDRRPTPVPGEQPPRASGSKHGRLYMGDDRSVLSAEYMVGSVPASAEMSPVDSRAPSWEEKGGVAEPRHVYVRMSSSASLSISIDEMEEGPGFPGGEPVG